MEKILKGKWHLHFVVGSLLMAIFMWLFLTYDDNLRYPEKVGLSLFFVFFVAGVWEWSQSRSIPTAEKPSIRSMAYDVLAGVIGAVAFVIFDIIGINLVGLITVLAVGFILELYKRVR